MGAFYLFPMSAPCSASRMAIAPSQPQRTSRCTSSKKPTWRRLAGVRLERPSASAFLMRPLRAIERSACTDFKGRCSTSIEPVRYLRKMEALHALQNAHRYRCSSSATDARRLPHRPGQPDFSEAPVPIVDVHQRDKRLGGAANVAKNLIARCASAGGCDGWRRCCRTGNPTVVSNPRHRNGRLGRSARSPHHRQNARHQQWTAASAGG